MISDQLGRTKDSTHIEGLSTIDPRARQEDLGRKDKYGRDQSLH